MTNVSCMPGVYENVAYRAIHAYYERCLRKSVKEIPFSLLNGDK
jgi:hypothetical protein